MHRRSRLLFLAILILVLGLASAQAAQPAAAPQSQSAAAPSPQAPANGQFKVWLQAPHSLAPRYQGKAAAVNGLNSGAGTPLALAAGDFNEDGVQDLVVGYATASGGALAIYRGNLDAFAPQSQASFDAIAHGQFPDPFLRTASVMDVPSTPDFLATGDFNGDGDIDIVMGSRGSATLLVFFGDGHGRFTQPLALALPSPVTALAAGHLLHRGPMATLLVGTASGPKGGALLVFAGSKLLMSFPMPAPVTSLAFGNLRRGAAPDTAMVVGGQVMILRGNDLLAAAAGNFNFHLENVALPLSAVSVDVGTFLFDRTRRQQMAVMSSDGSISIVAPAGLDATPWTLEEFRALRQASVAHHPLPPPAINPNDGWMIAETFPAVGGVGATPPIMMRTRVSGHGPDDVAVVDSATGQMHVLAHETVGVDNGSGARGSTSMRGDLGLASAYAPVAALPMRVNVDGRPGMVILNQGQVAPAVVMPLPDPTFTVNRTDDPVPASPITNACNGVANDCSLREAVLRANAAAGPDTIMLPAGTYTLTRGRIASPAYDAVTGTLNVNDSLTIVGAVDGGGNPTSIVTWGTLTSGLSVDMIFAVNEDFPAPTAADGTFSNLVIESGVNHGTHGADGDGGCMEYDGGTNGTANLTLTNVTIQNCATLQGGGGGLVIFNVVADSGTPGATGTATISNSIIQNNSAVDNPSSGPGGGIAVSNDAHLIMSNSKVLNNNATQVISGQKGQGGGIIIFFPSFTGSQNQIHNSTISGNKAAGFGGGIQDQANLLIDQGTVISGNIAGTDGTNPVAGQEGGGLYLNNFPAASCPVALTCTATLTKVTITGNSATGNGGGISTGNVSGAGPLTMSFSRLAGNTSSGGSGSNLNNNHTTATVTNNWWGTDAAGTTINTINSGVTTFDPFIVLTHTASPTIIKINQSTTLTGDMSKDNHGNAVGLANLTEIIGLPITFDNAVLGTIPQAQPETLNANAQATATFNAGGTGGRGTANGTVDQAVVPVNSNLIASATEAGTTVTITTVGAHGFAANESVVISGVGVGGYNGTFTITGTPTATTFTYTATAGLGASSGGSADVGILILEPLQIVKSFVPTTVAVNAPSALTLNVTNPNAIAVDGSFTDALPGTMVVAATPGVTNTCGGSVTAVAGSTSFSFVNASLPAGACTITVNVSSPSDGVLNNSVTISSTAAGTGAQSTSSASLTVINPPTIAKNFGAATIPLNGSTSLTFTISNTNTTSTLNGIAFTDSLPAGLIVATPGNLNSTCSGTATAVDGSGSVSLSGASLAAGASCTVSLNATGTTSGVKNNSVQASSTNGGTGNTSNASVTVVSPPVIIKAFGAASIPLSGSTSLTFTIQNNNTTTTLTGIGFSDTLPAGLIISTPNGLTGSCGGGTITATQATNVISLSGATLAQSSSCTFSVNVDGTAAGIENNTTGNVTSTEGGTGGTASASLNVVAPPSIAKAFNPTTIALNATTSLTFTITNPAANTVALNGVAFTDTLPTGLTVANASATVCGGTLTTTAPTGIALSGATIAVNSQCQFSVTVTGAASGQYTNTTGAVTSTNGGTGNTATANLTVAVPPSITKVFGAASVPLNGTTSLTFTINNPNAGVALTGLAFTDNLPAGLVVATPNNLNNTCGGTATAVAGSGSVSLSAGTLAASASCTVSVDVTGTTAGVKNNSVQVTSTEGGTGNTSNASITVVGPPVIIKAFGAASIPLNGSTSLSFTIQNNNTTTTLTGIGFSDTLPAGLVISTPNGLTGSCGGGTITATQATNVISLSGATLAQSSSCTFSVNVTGTAAGSQNNTTGNVTSTEGGTGGTASASLAVVAPPSIAKAFNPAAIALNATTSLTFTITNPAANTVAATGVAFTDTLPTGLTVANASATVCGGTLTTTAPTGIALSGATIAVNSQCQFSVTVTGAASGQYTNTTGNVTSTNGGTGNTATANLTVAIPPTITKAFGAASIPLNGTTSLLFSITNPNTTVTLTGLAFTDNLPAGLVVASTPNLNNTCGGTATAVGGSGSVSLSAGTLASSASCTVSVDVTGTTAGVKNNSVQVTSTEGGTGNTSNASITVVGPPVIIKAFGAASVPLGGSTSLTFTIQNNNTTQSLSGIGFSDTLPAGLIISTPNGLTGSCGGGTITATQATNVISLSGATLAQSSSCTFSVNVDGTAAGTENNTTGQVTSTEGGTGGTASASLSVVAPPTIAKAFNPIGTQPNGISTMTVTITNPAINGVAEAGVAFTDSLPANVVVATPNGLTNTCGGTATATAGSGTVSLTGGTIAVNSSCTVSVNVTSPFTGVYLNDTGPVSSTNGGTGGSANATLTVAFPPTISKLFLPDTIAQNGTTLLSFTITNPNSNSTPPNSDVTLTNISFTDLLPAGLQIANPPNLSSDCGGVVTAVAGGTSITLTGGSLGPAVGLGTRPRATRPRGAPPASNGSCFISVQVTPTVQGTLNNTSGPISADESGLGATSNTATLTVTAPPLAPTLIKAFGAASIMAGQNTSLTFTVTNPNASTNLVNTTFTDVLPSGLVVATPNNLSGTCIATFGASVIANPGSGSVDLASLNLPASQSCSFSVNVTANTPGTKNNLTGNITATFDDGGGNFPTLTGGTASATLTVTAVDFTIGAVPASNTVTAGGSATYTVTITPNPAPFPSQVTLSVTGLPMNTTAVLLPNPIPNPAGPINAPTNSTLTIITTPRTASLTRPAGPFGTRPQNQLAMALSLGSFGFLGIVFVGMGGDKRRKRLVLLLLALVVLGVVAAGCGGTVTQGPPGNNGTPPGTYTITITGTAPGNGGTITHSTNVTLVVN